MSALVIRRQWSSVSPFLSSLDIMYLRALLGALIADVCTHERKG